MSNAPTFSVCSLCRNIESVNFIESQIKATFPYGSEYLVLDNTLQYWDCYSAIRHFIAHAEGDYIVIIHDDVSFEGLTSNILYNAISEIVLKNKTASLFGIAGISSNSRKGLGHFHDLNGEQKWGFDKDRLVSSLDECFLVIKAGYGLNVSDELEGYHFYGTDLCINAIRLGLSSYVIDYPILHKSGGTLNEEFFLARDRFQHHLKKVYSNSLIKTTCTFLYSGDSWFKECWSLALSYVLVESSKHPDSRSAHKSIINRVRSKSWVFLFIIMVLSARFNSALDHFLMNIRWHADKLMNLNSRSGFKHIFKSADF
jgi:hypothetical protein